MIDLVKNINREKELCPKYIQDFGKNIKNTQQISIIVLGQTGCGKSTLSNLFLNQKFTPTVEVKSLIKFFFNQEFAFDSPGITYAEKKDTAFLNTLKYYKSGINELSLVFDSQNLNFDYKMQQLIRYYNDFIKNPKIWEQSSLIFTKCSPSQYNKTYLGTKFKNSVINYIKKLPGCQNINPTLPCFFIDSKNWEESKETQSELIRIIEFAKMNEPISLNAFHHLIYDDKEEEKQKLKNFFTKNEATIKRKEIDKENSAKTKVRPIFSEEFKTENQIIYRRISVTDPEGHVTFGKWRKVTK